MYSDDPKAYRQAFFDAWQKYQKQLPLEALERQLVEVILLHPAYHGLFQDLNTLQEQSFTLEENPFFHLSLHLAINDQLKLDRPKGIVAFYQALSTKKGEPHEVLHCLMQGLAKALWQAQQTGVMPNDAEYLDILAANI